MVQQLTILIGDQAIQKAIGIVLNCIINLISYYHRLCVLGAIFSYVKYLQNSNTFRNNVADYMFVRFFF